MESRHLVDTRVEPCACQAFSRLSSFLLPRNISVAHFSDACYVEYARLAGFRAPCDRQHRHRNDPLELWGRATARLPGRHIPQSLTSCQYIGGSLFSGDQLTPIMFFSGIITVVGVVMAQVPSIAAQRHLAPVEDDA